MGWFNDLTGIDSGIDLGVDLSDLDPTRYIDDALDTIDEWIIEDLLGIKIPDLDLPATPEGVLVTKKGNVQPLPVVYGTRRLGGLRVFVETTGTKNEFLHIVLALCEGEVDAIASLWINDIEVHPSQLDGAGDVTTGAFTGLLRIKKHLGADAQAADADLVSEVTSWTVDHRLGGVAYVYLRCKWDQANRAFGSFPKVQVDIKGRTLYDPRDESTAYSSNPALCLYDYLTNARYGRGLVAADLDVQSFKDAADYCDVLVTPFVGSGLQHARYSCDGIVDTGGKVLDNARELLGVCRGWLPYVSGQWRLVLDKPETAAFTFDASNIIGGLSISQAGRRGRLNRVQASYVNPAEDYASDIVVVDSSVFRAADNDLLLERRVSLPYTTSVYRAEAMTELQLKQSRQGLAVSFRATLAALVVAVGDVVGVTHATPGWSGKLFRVSKIDLLSDATVGVSMIEYEPTVYDLTLPIEAPTAPDTNLPNPNVVTAPTGLALSSGSGHLILGGDGSILSRVFASWVPSDDAFLERYDVEFRRSAGAEVVSGGGFNVQADVDAWTPYLAVQTLDVGRIKLAHPFDSIQVSTTRTIGGLAVGVEYILSADVEQGAGSGNVGVSLSNGASGSSERATSGSVSLVFTPTATSVDVTLNNRNTGEFEDAWFDNVSILEPAGTYLPAASPRGQAADSAYIVGVADGSSVDVRVRAVNTNGTASAWLESLGHTVLGKSDLPPDVATFVVTEQASGVRQFDWTLTDPPVDLAGYKIRYGVGSGLPWGSMDDLHAGLVVASPVETGLLAADDYTFGIKAVDTTGNESAAMVWVNKTLGSPPTGGGALPPFDWGTEITGAGKPADNADVTAANVAAGIAGQGALATQSEADWATQVGGAGKPDNNADVTAANVAAGIAGQGALATLNTVDTAQISDNAVTSTKLITNAVTETKITSNAVTAPKIAANAVTADKIIANAVTAVKIAANAVTAAKIAALAVTADKIAANTITAGQIAALTITANEIAAGAVTAAKISVANLSAINANLGNAISGTLQSAGFITTGGFLTAAVTGGATTLPLTSTADFAAAGSGQIIGSTNDRDIFSWTGKTSTTLTGCSGVLANPIGSAVVPGDAKTVLISNAVNEIRFTGDRGDGVKEELANIGIKADGGDSVVGSFGSISSGNSRLAMYLKAYSSHALQAYSSQNHGISATTGGGAATAGIFTQGATYGSGIYSLSSLGYGGKFGCGAGSGGMLQLIPASSTATPTHVAAKGTLWMTNYSTGRLFKNINGSTSWASIEYY